MHVSSQTVERVRAQLSETEPRTVVEIRAAIGTLTGRAIRYALKSLDDTGQLLRHGTTYRLLPDPRIDIIDVATGRVADRGVPLKSFFHSDPDEYALARALIAKGMPAAIGGGAAPLLHLVATTQRAAAA